MAVYTKKETDFIIEQYSLDPCLATVMKLAIKINKPKKSIISKLSKEGVYITKGYTDKQGQPVITKLAIVRDIETKLTAELPGLDKSPKGTLKMLQLRVQELHDAYEEAMCEVETLSEVVRVLKEARNG